MIIKGYEHEWLDSAADPKGAEIMKIARAIDYERPELIFDLGVKLLD